MNGYPSNLYRYLIFSQFFSERNFSVKNCQVWLLRIHLKDFHCLKVELVFVNSIPMTLRVIPGVDTLRKELNFVEGIFVVTRGRIFYSLEEI